MQPDFTVLRQRAEALRGLLEAIAPGPPTHPGERFFHKDLEGLNSEALSAERYRLRLRLLLTPPADVDCWPTTWLRERLGRVEALLRQQRLSNAWSKVRR